MKQFIAVVLTFSLFFAGCDINDLAVDSIDSIKDLAGPQTLYPGVGDRDRTFRLDDESFRTSAYDLTRYYQIRISFMAGAKPGSGTANIRATLSSGKRFGQEQLLVDAIVDESGQAFSFTLQDFEVDLDSQESVRLVLNTLDQLTIENLKIVGWPL